MALSPVLSAGTALAALAPFVEYLRPKRSPYLLVVFFGIAGVVLGSGLFQERFDDRHEFYLLFVPVAGVLLLLTFFSFMHSVLSGGDLPAEEVDEQLKFSRSICISMAIMCLVLGCWVASERLPDWVFYFHYAVCILQILVFVVYSAARLKYEEPASGLNNFQIALVTTLYLIAATICMGLINFGVWDIISVFEVKVKGDGVSGSALNLYFLSSALFYVLWFWCQVYWLRRLIKIINISITPPSC